MPFKTALCGTNKGLNKFIN